MEPGGLDENVKQTTDAMKDQTGKEPGGPTGLCHLVIVGALTGRHIDFTLDVTRDNQLKLESETGLSPYPVVVDRHLLMSDAITTILGQDQVPFEALILTGKVLQKDETHAIAIVPHDEDQGYSVVDSLVEDAVERYTSIDDAVEHVNGRFDTVNRKLRYDVVLTEQEKRRRFSTPGHQPVQVGFGVHI